jgi:uncharacterized iron-regulated membrane protein
MHRWIAVGLMALLIPISLSGAMLVAQEPLDALIHPGRYATTGAAVAQPPSVYLAKATAVLAHGVHPVTLRFPAERGRPVTVSARAAAGSDGGPPRLFTVYLDPPTSRVLDVVDVRASFTGLVHRFHENLTVPAHSGRQIVGWAGVGMLTLSLSGLWLWWPRNGAFARALRWRRSPATSANLHHLVGFWIALPLALVSATGIYLAFPQTAHQAMSSVAAMAPQVSRQVSPQVSRQASRAAGQTVRETSSTADQALAAALAAQPGMSARAIVMAAPVANVSQTSAWRVDLRAADGGDRTLLVDDRTLAVHDLPDALAGDRAAQWIRRIHQGEVGGPLWRLALFVCGIMPSVLGVTGIVGWMRGRRRRRLVDNTRRTPQLAGAE